ncbi:mycofactocin radical SAM maturase [Nocardia sp. NPDC005366]|uniref:mycofactocin radical SAM maturase n=1 Tax=Nocardia sp. NPDC005366 TaxID=3156878 RepID=UPI00339F4280
MNAPRPVVGQLGRGPAAPHRVSWELTTDRELSGAVFPSTAVRELSTAECLGLVEEFARMRVSHLDIAGGEPTARSDFWRIVEDACARRIGVGFRTDGRRLTPSAARLIAGNGYIDARVRLDGATEAANDAIGGVGSYRAAIRAMELLASSGVYDFAVDVVLTRHNVGQLDAMAAVADLFGARLRPTRARPAGQGTRLWHEARPNAGQERDVRRWMREHDDRLRGDDAESGIADSGDPRCGAGRVACLIDSIGDVYACPFAAHDALLAGNIRAAGGFGPVWRYAPLFERLRGADNDGPCVSCAATGHLGHEDLLASFGRSA